MHTVFTVYTIQTGLHRPELIFVATGLANTFSRSCIVFKKHVIYAFSEGVKLGNYCENLCTYCVRFCTNVEINSKVGKARIFHWFSHISNYLGTFVANKKESSQIMRSLA